MKTERAKRKRKKKRNLGNLKDQKSLKKYQQKIGQGWRKTIENGEIKMNVTGSTHLLLNFWDLNFSLILECYTVCNIEETLCVKMTKAKGLDPLLTPQQFFQQ